MNNGSLAGSRFIGEAQHLPDWGTMITDHVKVNGAVLALDREVHASPDYIRETLERRDDKK